MRIDQNTREVTLTEIEYHELINLKPEVDLEKEVKRWKNKHGVVGMDDLWLNFARDFFELGLNARNK